MAADGVVAGFVDRGARDLVDECPLNVILAQLTGAAPPSPVSHAVEQPASVARDGMRGRRGDRDDAARFFALGLDEILFSIDAGERRDRCLRPGGQHDGAPACDRGREADRGNGMPEIVLAVTERPLTVLPGLAPMNGRERDQQDVDRPSELRHPRLRTERASLLERMTIRRVVIDGRRVGETVQRRTDDIRLGRMEVAARRVDA